VTPHVYNSQFLGDNLHNPLTVFSSTVTPEYGCGLQPKYVGASKLCVVQFIGNKIVCTQWRG